MKTTTTPVPPPNLMNQTDNSTKFLKLLSHLLLDPDAANLNGFSSSQDDVHREISTLSQDDLAQLWSLANSHHVIARTFPRLLAIMQAQKHERAEWVSVAIAKEDQRIQHALSFIEPICAALAQVGNVIVIKSLDHWPDLGNDIDLFSDAAPSNVVNVMTRRFKARADARSWGDRLAGKWNFVVPELPELVEVHMCRLGQTGEQVAITNSLVTRSQTVEHHAREFRVPAPEDRLIISTLQRMYRHFYFRLCDVADTAALVDSGVIDYPYLKTLAQSAGLWDGLATYLVTVSGYVKSYRGVELALPPMVKDAARFGNELVYYKRKFMRIPIFPQAARLYASEWARLLLNGELQSTLRLSLLPPLAAAAAIEMKLTGSDKGIW